MKLTISSAVVSFAVLASAAYSQPWVPSDCGHRFDASWRAFAQAMQEAKPGSPIYAPKPFPKTVAEVIENFKYGYAQMWKRTRWVDLPEDERPFFRAVQNETLALRIERVENWTPTRCLAEHQKDFFYLLYVTDTASGQEVARFTLNQNGLVSGWAVSPSAKDAIAAPYRAAVAPKLTAAVASVRSRFGVKADRAQYVTTYGTPMECPVVAPCIALQAGSKSYLLKGMDLFVLGPPSREHSLSEMNDRIRRQKIAASLADHESLVSIGAERWTVVRPVSPVR